MSEYNSKGKLRGFWIMAVLLLVLTLVKFYPLSVAPNSHYPGDSGDGIRSLLVTRYHLKHDTSYLHYGGMNYPYGEILHFTGGQPLVTNSIKWFSQNVYDIQAYSIGVLFSLLMISFYVGGIFIFLLLRALKLPDWYAILLTIGITFLAPQNDRFSAHYELAYSYFLPLLLYALYRFEEALSWRWSIGIVLILLFTSQLQSYLFALCLFFLAAYFFIRILCSFSNGKWKHYFLHACLQLLVSGTLFLLYSNSLDNLTDRPTHPYGFLVYVSYWFTIFISPEFWSGQWARWFIPPTTWVTPEAYAYIGLGTSILLAKELLLRIGRWALNKWRVIKGTVQTALPSQWPIEARHRSYLGSILGAASLLLLLSMGIPFIYPPFDQLIESIGPFRQFRSLGRFAWPFFYAANIVAFYLLYHQAQAIKRPWLKWGLLGVFLTGLLLESAEFTVKKRPNFHPPPEERQGWKRAQNPWVDSLDLTKYQAILPLPYFHIGSENIWMEPTGKNMQRAFWMSELTGLPNMGVFMGRTSISQTINQLEFVAEPYRRPLLLDDLPNDKPLLVLIDKVAWKQRWYRFNHLLYGLGPIYENQWFKLYELPPKLIEQRISERMVGMEEEMDTSQLYPNQQLLSKDSFTNFVFDSFDDRLTDKRYRGAGAWQGKGSDFNLLFKGQLPDQRADFRYVYSAWHFIREDLHMKSIMTLTEYDGSTKAVLQKKQYRMANYIRSIDGDWALSDIPFRLKKADSQVQLHLDNIDLKDQLIYMDEFQVRSHQAVLFKKTSKEFVRNNRWFPYQKTKSQ